MHLIPTESYNFEGDLSRIKGAAHHAEDFVYE